MSRLYYPVKHHNGTVSYGAALLPLGKKEAQTFSGCESKTLLISISSGWVGQGRLQETKPEKEQNEYLRKKNGSIWQDIISLYPYLG